MKGIYIFIAIIVVLILIVLGVVLFYHPKVNISDIKSFRYHYTMGTAFNADVLYELNCEDKCIALVKAYGESEEDAKEYNVDSDFVSKLSQILNENNVGAWDGFNESDNMVLDGDSFSISVHSSEKNYSATGYMRWPKDYAKVKEEINDLFNSLK